MYELEASAAFDAAHFLTDYHGKCENLHGHRWQVTARIAAEELGREGTGRGMVCDFAAFKRALREEVAAFDHTFIVEEGSLQAATVAALEAEGFTLKIVPYRTTAENLARHIFEGLLSRGLPVASVECDETPNNRAVYRV